MNFLVSEGTDLVGGDLGHGDGSSIKGGKFNPVAPAAVIDVDDRSDIDSRKPVFSEAGRQRHSLQVFDHAGRGYAVIKRGASVVSQSRLPVSVRKRQRTAALQDARARSNVPDIAKRLGVRLSSAALAGNCGQCIRNSETPH
jgi:hypothetical protein